MRITVALLLFTQAAFGQIGIDSLILLSRSKDAEAKAIISKLIYENSTIQLKKGARGFTKIGDKLNIYESKDIQTVNLIESVPRYLKTTIDGTQLFFLNSDYVNNSISSPLIDTIAMHFIKNGVQIKLRGINEQILREITKLSYSFDISVKVDTTFTATTPTSLSKVDYSYLGKVGNYYKLTIPSLSEQVVYVTRKSIDNKVLSFNKDIIKKFIPTDHVNFFAPDNSHYSKSPGQFVSSYSSSNYSSVTYRNGNSYITTTKYNGGTTTSTYTIDY